MNNKDLKPPNSQDVDKQLNEFQSIFSPEQSRLLKYLIDLQRGNYYEKYPDVKCETVLIEYFHPEEELGGEEQDEVFSRGRQEVTSLRNALRHYYQKWYERLGESPGQIVGLRIPNGHGYRIQIYWEVNKNQSLLSAAQPVLRHYTPMEKQKSLQSKRRRRDQLSIGDHVVVEYRGNNITALEYINDKIPKLNRIEETFVRWIEGVSYYHGDSARTFNDFVVALKKNRLLYRAVLGPLVDEAIFRQGGLRDVLSARVVKHPRNKPGTKLYRLLHSTAVVNFTLLYYAKPKNFWAETSDVEVLFGYGIYEQRGKPEDTVVFSSKDSSLVSEFTRLFKTLRNEDFSRQLDIDKPALFENEAFKCDVLATFPKFPEDEIVRRIQACGKGTSKSASHISICVTAWHLLDRDLEPDLLAALDRRVKVSIALWRAKSLFLKLRQKMINPKSDYVKHEIRTNRETLTRIGKRKNLSVRWCKGEHGSVSIFWIDDLIYFSAYWIGSNISHGPHFLVSANSPTGKQLQEQYRRMLKTSVNAQVAKKRLPPASKTTRTKATS